jgi:hypothetical protein
MNGPENTLGWREWLTFPELGITQVKAKVDTGARTSCLHAFFVEQFERQGVAWVRFGIHPEQDDTETEVICEAIIKDRRSVRDSGGHEEIRYVIDTEVLVGSQSQRVEVTLTDRDTMKFRCLLGRSAIRGKYLVDPARSYLQGKRKRRHQKPR